MVLDEKQDHAQRSRTPGAQSHRVPAFGRHPHHRPRQAIAGDDVVADQGRPQVGQRIDLPGQNAAQRGQADRQAE